MTLDRERIAQRLEVLERLLRDWEEASSQATASALEKDRKTCLFLCYVMESAIQVSLDLANHLIANLGYARPANYRESFGILGSQGWFSKGLAKKLEELAGFRNILVHQYPDLDFARMLPHVKRSWKTLRELARVVARRALKRR